MCTLEGYDDYINDGRWNPVHPTLLSICDSDGNLDVWDLGASIENPDARLNMGSSALNCVAWDETGYRLSTGNTEGAVMICSIDKEAASHRNEEWYKLKPLAD